MPSKKDQPREFYEKIGRRYRKLGIEFPGFPADGIWQVMDGKRGATLLISPEEILPIHALAYRTHRENLARYVQAKQKEKGAYSLYDVLTWACDYFAEVAGKEGSIEEEG